MHKEGKFTKPQIVRLLNKTMQLLRTEPNLVPIKEPVCVVGDIHGQYYDLLNMISKAGEPGMEVSTTSSWGTTSTVAFLESRSALFSSASSWLSPKMWCSSGVTTKAET